MAQPQPLVKDRLINVRSVVKNAAKSGNGENYSLYLSMEDSEAMLEEIQKEKESSSGRGIKLFINVNKKVNKTTGHTFDSAFVVVKATQESRLGGGGAAAPARPVSKFVPKKSID